MPARRLSLVLLVGLFAFTNLMPGESMQFDRDAIAAGEIWRLWTGQLCHWSLLHLLGNLAAVAAFAVIAGTPLLRWLALLPLAAPLLSLVLLSLMPALQIYRGFSGLVAMLVVGVAMDGGLIGRVVALAWGARLVFDAIAGTPSPFLPEGITTTWQAHLAGLLLGMAAGAVFLHFDRNTASPS
ncbi:MAG TPA: rhomboid family intramembrane serine protease [Zoogloea sp.]|nr:rhomboid family intramembrane serine protease [Zoogloea sp.]